MNRLPLKFSVLASLITLYAACSRPAPVNEPQANNTGTSIIPAPQINSETGFVYVANEDGNSISVIDLSSGQVREIATGLMPHNVQISRDGRLLLAVGIVPAMAMAGNQVPMKMSAAEMKESGALLILDAGATAVDGAAEIKIGRHPAHVVIDAQGKLAYATNSEDNTISVIAVAQKKVVGEIKTGKFPHGLRLSPDGREIYAANVNDNSVSIIDTAKAKEVMRLPVGKAPVQVGFTPDGRQAYVSLRDENRVAVIDTALHKVIATVAVGRNPIQLFATPDGRFVYVANQGTETNPDNTVSVIDTATHLVTATIETGKGAHGVVISDDGRRVYVTNTVDDTVSVIDTATQKVIKSFKVGKGPNGITFKNAIR